MAESTWGSVKCGGACASLDRFSKSYQSSTYLHLFGFSERRSDFLLSEHDSAGCLFAIHGVGDRRRMSEITRWTAWSEAYRGSIRWLQCANHRDAFGIPALEH